MGAAEALGRRGVKRGRYDEALRVQGRRHRQHVEEQLNVLGAQGWQVVGVTTKKQLLIAPPQAIILMRELQSAGEARAAA
jgi:hypothetical protein